MDSGKLEQILCGFMPVLKIDKTKFLIGTDVKTVLVKSDLLLVRTGGGFITLQEHMGKICFMECIRIHQLMDKNKASFRNVVTNLLRDNLATGKAKEQFLANVED